MSAFTAPISKERWIQDRQNFVSLYHDKLGLFAGGGNTKLQPLWSTFTVGDTALLHHKPGTTQPNFIPPKGIIHTPGKSSLDPENLSLVLEYGKAKCAVRVDFSQSPRAKLIYELKNQSDLPVEAHVTLLPKMKSDWKTAAGTSGKLTDAPLHLKSSDIGSWFEYRGVRISVPKDARIQWPVLPHNPYTIDGHAEPQEARLVIILPLGTQPILREVDFEEL
jgi:hypothetical protein